MFRSRPVCVRAWAKSMSSLTRRDSMLLMAGFPETSYPWLRCAPAPLLLFLAFWTWCSLSVLCSQIRFTSAAYPKTLVKRTFKVVSEK